ncbi:MAG: FadR family transcriptional regulator [Acidobacteria bacterium]|nr:FadR family transcriptional regulator [Acidobacteriota bacterium]
MTGPMRIVNSTGPQKEDITTKLISSFKTLIADGVLVPGCKLPPERELARRFGVSRPSLRQALKVLEIMGVIWQRIGDGTYLNTSAAAILGEPVNFLILLDGISHSELFETRLIVEPELAARAAERATVEDLAALRQALVNMEKGGTLQARLEADLAFHEAIFKASGNRMCQLVFSVIHRAVFLSMERFSHMVGTKRRLAFHKAIYSAIYKRSPEEARHKMTDHLLDGISLLREAKGQQGGKRVIDHISALSKNSSKRGKKVV